MSMRSYPFISLPHALIVMRVAVAIFFMAHAAVRIANGSIPSFAGFLASKGIPFGLAVVWLISVYELAAGMLMALGYCVRWMTTGFLTIAIGGIVLIHWERGWFVGEHGIGGMEYSLCLIVALLVLAAADAVFRDHTSTEYSRPC